MLVIALPERIGALFRLRQDPREPRQGPQRRKKRTLTSDTGYFWFFSANNIEMVIKVVNGCGFNSRYWTFAGGLTNVSVTMTVTDTQTGTVKTYVNPQGIAFQPIQDTSAFATCP